MAADSLHFRKLRGPVLAKKHLHRDGNVNIPVRAGLGWVKMGLRKQGQLTCARLV